MLHPHIQSLIAWDNEHAIGNSDLDNANSRIAMYLRSRGRYGEAETLYGRVLASRKTKLGPAHPDTLGIINEVAIVYQFKEAELLGPEHPDTLLTLNNLAYIYNSLGRHKEAEILYTRTLAGCLKVFGSAHPDTLRTVRNATNLFKAQDRQEEATLLESQFPLAFESS
jgi:tetratricopeptide (TPR) repeat protein